jgi:hypothetical protein
LIERYNSIPLLPNIGSNGSGGISNAGNAGASGSSDLSNSSATDAQLRAGALRAGTTVNNITVQAVDSEGAARAVAKVLNQSASRSVPQLYNSGITRAR